MGRWWRSTLWLTALVGLGCGAPPEAPPAASGGGAEPVVGDVGSVSPAADGGAPGTEACDGWDVVPPEPPVPSPAACEEVVEAPAEVAGLRVSRRYDAAGRLLLLERFSSTGERLALERSAYDAAGRRVLAEQEGALAPPQREQRGFDGCGRLAWREQSFSTGDLLSVHRSRFTYGPEARAVLEESESRGPGDAHATATTRTSRDAAGRLVRREHEGLEGQRTFLRSERWDYDARGLLLEQLERGKDWGGATWSSQALHAYDARGLPLRSEQWFDGALASVTEREYDAEGRLLTETTPALEEGGPGFRARHAWDAQGRHLEHVEEELGAEGPVEVRRTSWSHAPDGGWTEVHWDRDSGADTWTRTYDAAGRLLTWDEQNFLSATFRRGSRTYGPEGELLREEASWATAGASSASVTQHAYGAGGMRTRSELVVTRTEGGEEVRTERLVTYDALGRPALAEEWRVGAAERVLVERLVYRYACSG